MRGMWSMMDGGYVSISEDPIYTPDSQWALENHDFDPENVVETNLQICCQVVISSRKKLSISWCRPSTASTRRAGATEADSRLPAFLHCAATAVIAYSRRCPPRYR
jgi:hypothetical protein